MPPTRLRQLAIASSTTENDSQPSPCWRSPRWCCISYSYRCCAILSGAGGKPIYPPQVACTDDESTVPLASLNVNVTEPTPVVLVKSQVTVVPSLTMMLSGQLTFGSGLPASDRSC